jgi:hypothetical protein
LKTIREKREEMKRNKLQKRTRDELTQEAKEAKRLETGILEGRLKSTMKRVAKSAKRQILKQRVRV